MTNYMWTIGKSERRRQTGAPLGPGPGGGGGSTIDANMWFSFDDFPPQTIYQGEGFMCSVKVTSEHDTSQTIQVRVIVEGDQISSKHLLGGGELTIPANSSNVIDMQFPPSELNLPEGNYDLGIYRSMDGLLDFQVSTPVTMVPGTRPAPDNTDETPDNTNETPDNTDETPDNGSGDTQEPPTTGAKGLFDKAINYAKENPTKAAIGALGVAYVTKPKQKTKTFPGTTNKGKK